MMTAAARVSPSGVSRVPCKGAGLDGDSTGVETGERSRAAARVSMLVSVVR
jgi:hypothetical protein